MQQLSIVQTVVSLIKTSFSTGIFTVHLTLTGKEKLTPCPCTLSLKYQWEESGSVLKSSFTPKKSDSWPNTCLKTLAGNDITVWLLVEVGRFCIASSNCDVYI